MKHTVCSKSLSPYSQLMSGFLFKVSCRGSLLAVFVKQVQELLQTLGF